LRPGPDGHDEVSAAKNACRKAEPMGADPVIRGHDRQGRPPREATRQRCDSPRSGIVGV
jgi:hypothetical protein